MAMKPVLVAQLTLVAGAVQAMQCGARSPATTSVLVELYTSEGCDSCPPADRWLSSLGARGSTPGRDRARA